MVKLDGIWGGGVSYPGKSSCPEPIRFKCCEELKEARKPRGGMSRSLTMLLENKHPVFSPKAARNPVIFNVKEGHGGKKVKYVEVLKRREGVAV